MGSVYQTPIDKHLNMIKFSGVLVVLTVWLIMAAAKAFPPGDFENCRGRYCQKIGNIGTINTNGFGTGQSFIRTRKKTKGTQGQQGNGGQDSDFQNCRGGVCQHITQPIQVLNQGTQQTQPQNQGMKHPTINNCKGSTNNGCVSVSGIVTGGTAINWGGTSQSQNPNNSPTTGNHGIQQTQPQGQQGNGGQDSDFQNCRGGVCQHITQPIQVLNQRTQQTQPQNQGMKHQ